MDALKMASSVNLFYVSTRVANKIRDFLCIQKCFDNINMDALTDMQKWLVINVFLLTINYHFLIDHIKAKVQMMSHGLHSVHNTSGIE